MCIIHLEMALVAVSEWACIWEGVPVSSRKPVLMARPMFRTSDNFFANYQQGFILFFTEDGFETPVLLEACSLAGCNYIEYTLRYRGADRIVPWIREHYTSLYPFVGSTPRRTSAPFANLREGGLGRHEDWAGGFTPSPSIRYQ